MSAQAQQIPTLDELQKRHVADVLEATHGNMTETAKLLGVNRRTLYRMIDRHGLNKARKCPTCGRPR